MGPREMLDRAEVENKWNLTPMKNFRSPRLTQRIWRTALVVLITSIIYEYVFDGRNPCFALIGAVYGVGSQFEEGFHNEMCIRDRCSSRTGKAQDCRMPEATERK